MTRIVAGAARGRRLRVPPGVRTRPTSERAREALFSTVEAVLGRLHGRRVLDLYAGSGTVGLEALSRGAAHVLLVESDARALGALRANAALVGSVADGLAEVRRAPVERLAAGLADLAYDVVFADPPYAVRAETVHRVLAALAQGGWLAPDALVVVERATRDTAWTWPAAFRADRERRYGEGTLWYGRAPRPADP